MVKMAIIFDSKSKVPDSSSGARAKLEDALHGAKTVLKTVVSLIR